MTNILVTLLDDPMSHERRKGRKKKNGWRMKKQENQRNSVRKIEIRLLLLLYIK